MVGGGVAEDKSRRRGGPSRTFGPSEPGGRSTRGSRSAGSMGKQGNQGEGATEREAPIPTFRWEEIQKHNVHADRWLVVDRKVYNITKWAYRHPGGHRVIGHYAGEDATVRVWGLSRHLSLLQAGVGSHGSPGAKQIASAEWDMGNKLRKEGKSISCAHPLPRILVPWDSWADLPWGSDFGPWKAAPRWRSERYRTVQDLLRAQGPRSRFFYRVQPEPGTPQRGRPGPRALAPPSRKMAVPGRSGKEQERSQVWDSERVPHSPARLGSRE